VVTHEAKSSGISRHPHHKAHPQHLERRLPGP
jgi:hypothetical protein